MSINEPQQTRFQAGPGTPGPADVQELRSLEELVADACEAELHDRWDVSLALWRELQLRAPAQVDAYVGQATALRRLGRFDECDRLLREGMAEIPDDAHLHSNYAVTAHQRGDLIEAAQRQQDVLVRFPDNRPVMLLALTYLRQAKLFNEAEIVVKPPGSSNSRRVRVSGWINSPKRAQSCVGSRASEGIYVLRDSAPSADTLVHPTGSETLKLRRNITRPAWSVTSMCHSSPSLDFFASSSIKAPTIIKASRRASRGPASSVPSWSGALCPS